MMCEECGKNPAVFHFVTVFNSETTERNLCAACMAKYKEKLPGFDIRNLAGILNNLLEGTRRESGEETDPRLSALTCEQCGWTYGEFKKTGMLGCAECYHAFEEPLTSMLQRMHGNTQHAGRVPGGIHSGTSIRMNIERLKVKLKRAVEAEEYEEAAKYRDAIRSLTIQLEQKEHTVHVRPRPIIDHFEEGSGENE